jgi:uncharacterized protein
MAYLDTSILGSYYCPEELSAVVNRELTGLHELVISPLVEVEFCSLAALKVRTREMNRAAAQSALGLFRQHLEEGYFRIVDVGPREYDTARTWLCGFKTSLRALDALHLACAFVHGQQFWTTDKPLAHAAESLGVDHRLLRLR